MKLGLFVGSENVNKHTETTTILIFYKYRYTDRIFSFYVFYESQPQKTEEQTHTSETTVSFTTEPETEVYGEVRDLYQENSLNNKSSALYQGFMMFIEIMMTICKTKNCDEQIYVTFIASLFSLSLLVSSDSINKPD